MKRWKLNNDGSAILTVVVVVAFITVLATTMLYLTSMNFQMKQTDYQNKQSFYKAEEALDVLKAELAIDMSDAFSYAYQEVMIQYANLEDKERQATFQAAFLDQLEDIWKKREEDELAIGGDLTTAIQEIVKDEGYDKNFVSPNVSEGEAAASFACDVTNARFVLQNVRVRYVQDGYSSFICTDIALCVPELELEHNHSSEIADGEAIPEREKIVLTDYIIYMNWSKY